VAKHHIFLVWKGERSSNRFTPNSKVMGSVYSFIYESRTLLGRINALSKAGKLRMWDPSTVISCFEVLKESVKC